MTPRARRIGIVASAALGALLLLVGVGYLLAARSLEAVIVDALGPDATVGAISLRLGHVRIDDVVVRAPPGWPAQRTLAARRVVVVPELRTLLSDRVRIASVTIEDAYLSVLRAGDGRVRLLPAITERITRPAAADAARAGAEPPRAPAGAPTPGSTPKPAPKSTSTATASASPPTETAHIGRVSLRGGTLEFFDASVRRPPHVLRIESVDADLTDLVLPALAARSALRVSGTVKAAPGRGATHDGRLSIDGSLVLASRDSKLRTTLRGVDLVALQPYLLKAADAGVRDGRLDLDLASTVHAGRLHAPGRIVLAGLELESSGRGSNAFLGLPRDAVLALLKDGSGRIELDFTLDGRLDDPRFSLSEDLAVRAAAAIAGKLGLGLGGLARDVGGAGQKAIDAATGAIRGLLGR